MIAREKSGLAAALALASLLVSALAGAAERVYFGDLHLHTRYSNDSWSSGETRTPDDSYRFARGEPVRHVGGTEIRLRTPLDFLAVSDHAEMLGALQALADPEHRDAATEIAEQARSTDYQTRRLALQDWARSMRHIDPNPVLFDRVQEAGGWGEIVATADRHYAPGAFTTFAAFEWTSSTPDFGNLHRVVVFEGTDDLPHPYSRVDSIRPEDLWSYLETQRMRGVDAIAIPHNANVSNGHMFALTDSFGEPLTAHYAARRTWNEPMLEATQHKGTSETHPALSPNDEFADFEIYSRLLSSLAGERYGEPSGSYLREAYLNGIALQAKSGFNPFQFGLSASSDTHNGTAGAVEEKLFMGHLGRDDDSKEENLGGGKGDVGGINASPGGLIGVWAEQNTRDSIFNAMRRKEVFGTSGPRMRLRMYAGWDFAPSLCAAPDRVSQADASGVPMGGNLPPRGDATAPSFLALAMADPGTEVAPGTPLQKLQMIKGWVDRNGDHQQRIIDIAGSPDNGASVDPASCETTGSGHQQLCAVWQDPEFDAGQSAVYYLRAVENPSCRWSQFQCNQFEPGEQPQACEHKLFSRSIQERAWSSPVWYRAEK